MNYDKKICRQSLRRLPFGIYIFGDKNILCSCGLITSLHGGRNGGNYYDNIGVYWGGCLAISRHHKRNGYKKNINDGHKYFPSIQEQITAARWRQKIHNDEQEKFNTWSEKENELISLILASVGYGVRPRAISWPRAGAIVSFRGVEFCRYSLEYYIKPTHKDWYGYISYDSRADLKVPHTINPQPFILEVDKKRYSHKTRDELLRTIGEIQP